jgi:general secretion pathway protein F/type IV pilus assembly protein PilC
MAEFRFLAREASGQQATGVLCAASLQEALAALSARSLFPVRVETVESTPARQRRVAPSKVAALYAQLADLLHAGVPLLRALELLETQRSGALAPVVSGLRTKVADGSSLAAAMQSHPQAFTVLAISMVQAGEEGGFIEEALKRVAAFTEQQEELKSRVLGAVAYPAFLIVTGLVVIVGMLVFFVPNFAPLFARLEEQGGLPIATTILLGTSRALTDHAWILAPLLALLGWLGWTWAASDAGRRQIDHGLLTCKLIGPVVRGLAVSRFCRVLGTLLQNGVPVLSSLRIAQGATGHRVLSDAIREATENISAGKSLAQPLAASGHFPPEVIEMIAVGESANSLDRVLIDLADSLERITKRKLDLFVRLLEPALLLVMAIVILFAVLGLLLPVFDITGNLS